MLLGRRTKKHFEFLFVNDVNNKPVIQTLNSIFCEFCDENSGMIYFDKRLGRPSENSINVFEYVGITTLLISIVHFVKMIPRFYSNLGVVNAISKKYRVNSIFLIFNCFDSIFAVNAVGCFFRKVSTAKIVLMTDVHKLSRVIVLSARENSISTFVIQHGTTVGEEGYLPITADKMLVWGQGSKRWFINNHEPESKLEVLGSPKMDHVRYAEPSLVTEKRLASILVIISSITLESDFLETVREAFENIELDKIEVNIKLHPGNPKADRAIVNSIFKNSNVKYKVLHFENLTSCLMMSDAVLLTTSSVGIEAIIHNKPIYQYKAGRLRQYTMDWEEFDCSHLYETGEQLFRLLSSPSLQSKKLKNYPSFVKYCFDTLDGNSRKRIKSYIKEYTI